MVIAIHVMNLDTNLINANSEQLEGIIIREISYAIVAESLDILLNFVGIRTQGRMIL